MAIIDNTAKTMREALANALTTADRVDIEVAFFYFSGWKLLAKLQRDKLVARGSIASDKRIKTIHVTSKEAKLLDAVWPGYTKKLISLTEGLEEDKKRLLPGMLSQWMGLISREAK